MVAGYFLLSYYVYAGLDRAEQTQWAPGFLMVGAVAVVFGGLMTLTWPLSGAYNSAYGEMSVLLGIVFLGAGLAIARGWSLVTVACYAFFAGWAAVLIGVRIINLGLSRTPALSGVGFILSGLAGVLAAPTLAYLKGNRPFRTLAAIVLAAAGCIWALTAYGAYWEHMHAFAGWQPLVMRAAGGP
jgi:putative membrane protein